MRARPLSRRDRPAHPLGARRSAALRPPESASSRCLPRPSGICLHFMNQSLSAQAASPPTASVNVLNGIHELAVDLSCSPHFSRDMAPTRRADRKWAMKDMAALWISMAACVPTYQLASSLITEGMNWTQAIFTIFLGNVIVLIPMVLNAHA